MTMPGDHIPAHILESPVQHTRPDVLGHHLVDFFLNVAEFTQHLDPYIINSDHVKASKIAAQSFHFLWELYNGDMECLNEMIIELASTLSEYSRSTGTNAPSQNNPEECIIIKSFFYPGYFLDHSHSQRTLGFYQKVNRDRQRFDTLQDGDLRRYSNIFMSLDEPVLEDRFKAIFVSKNLTLILQHLYQRLENAVQQAKTDVRSFVQRKADAPYRQEEISSSQIGADLAGVYQQHPENTSLLLFAVPGSGKTRSLRRLLSQHYGLYLQSCNVGSAYNGILNPSKYPGSRDSVFLGRFIQYVRRHPWMTTDTILGLIGVCFRNLVQWRLFMLAHFIQPSETFPQFAQRSPSLLPMIWFDLQTSDELNPFDQVVQLSCILPEAFIRRAYLDTSAAGHLPASSNQSASSDPSVKRAKDAMQVIRQKMVFLCLDEAQSDLEVLTESPGADSRPRNLFDHWIFAFRHARRWYQEQFSPSLSAIHFIYAGTSLEIKKVIDTVQDQTDPLYDLVKCSRTDDPFEPVWRYSRFPLIEGDVQFHGILTDQSTCAILEKSFPSLRDGLYKAVVKSGIALRGRPRWSVLYAQKVNQVLSSAPTGAILARLESDIDKAASNIQELITQDLQKRLQLLLDDPSRVDLIDSLCEMVTRCYLWDRPIAFASEHVPDMIADAFAVMKKVGGVESFYLAERTAAEAAWQIFSKPADGSNSRVDRYLLELMQLHQHDASAYSKAAEVFLAWSLYGALPHIEQRLCGSSRGLKVGGILSLFSKAIPLGRISTPGNGAPLVLSTHTGHNVVEGDVVGHDHNGSLELHEWLKDIRTGKLPTSTFYYPQNQAGPDLMFALRSVKPGFESSILCVLQLKCGAPEITKGIRTTDLATAYTTTKQPHTTLDGYEAKKQDLETELQACANTASFKILRILVTASAATGRRSNVQPGTECDEFYLRCDEAETELLFGPDFRRLLEAVRHKPKLPFSLSQHYRRHN